ncbi:signal transduction histidine kinase [Thermocatellispora tengchongensis]|uniref:histidine kinase n=1 Tax=Thermocatellispora tengchongensis TaxID=1073253 RepID=A0A840P412_9ACTN|nr:histidine kinase [Thermocatellispora tengchongensis]MBB5133729.1 signal transduction histidine kinase [Thermocatellispora tengchongensis]
MPKPWRGVAYLLDGLLTALATIVLLPVLALPAAAHAWAERHRRRAGLLLGVTVPDRPTPPAGRPWARWGRDLLWAVAHVATALPLGLAALTCLGNILTATVSLTLWWALPPAATPRLLGDIPVEGWTVALAPVQIVVLAAVAWLGGPPLARAHARLCLAVLSPSAAGRLTQRVEELTRTRAEALDAHAAELRRIERDLHDGVQAQLVAVALRLGVAGESLTGAPEGATRLVREAHEGVEQAMAGLRAVIRTAYPPILADRGLAGALTALAAGCGVPARVHIGELGAVPVAVETVAYFVVAEALTNAARHSRATSAEVRVERVGAMLSVRVTDDGIGGADEARGTGISGIRRRVLALDGTVQVTSPPGGPTTIAVEVPCGS